MMACPSRWPIWTRVYQAKKSTIMETDNRQTCRRRPTLQINRLKMEPNDLCRILE